jgi:F-type H+-transporting ATPase subunit gamma
MGDTLENMSRKMTSASKVRSIVHIMKIMAASIIRHCEKASFASDCYLQTVEKALISCFKKIEPHHTYQEKRERRIGAIILGTDMGLVGPFNEQLAKFAKEYLSQKQETPMVIGIGERMISCLQDIQLSPHKKFNCPISIEGISPFIIQVLSEIEELFSENQETELLVFYHRSLSEEGYEPVMREILPIEEEWKERLSLIPWPTQQIPELIENPQGTLLFLLKEYVFISLARACAESITCENSSRFLCMQRAEKNIDEVTATLRQNFHHLRQNTIDSELFDVLAGVSSIMNK